MTKAISYQYQFVVPRDKDGKPVFDDVKSLNQLSFGLNDIFNAYFIRKQFHFETSVFDYGQEGFPIYTISLSSIKVTTKDWKFQLAATVVPSKLIDVHRQLLHDGLAHTIDFVKDPEQFKIWWDNDPRGSRKRSLEDKVKILDEIRAMPTYNGSSDLQLEDIELTIEDALEFLGFNRASKPKDLKKIFKSKFRELQLKHHPDSPTGSDNAFMHLQNCREVVERWLKRS